MSFSTIFRRFKLFKKRLTLEQYLILIEKQSEEFDLISKLTGEKFDVSCDKKDTDKLIQEVQHEIVQDFNNKMSDYEFRRRLDILKQ